MSDLDARISRARLRLRARDPFFATLTLFARVIPREDIPTAQTDGLDIFYRPRFLAGLSDEGLEAVLLHEVLHAALLHVTRRGPREPVRWNVAADVVVNGMIAALPGLRLPSGAIREPALESRSVEEIYALLPETLPAVSLCMPGDEAGALNEALARLAEIEGHWRRALRQAEAIARQMGHAPAGLRRLIDEVAEPQIDWRAALWRFLVRTPTDFRGFDRRFLHQGLYLEDLDGESARVYLAVDTSGSVDGALLTSFLGEVRGVLSTYPHIKVDLFYADAALYGPYPLSHADRDEIPAPSGGGGTSFVPFFDWVARARGLEEGVCVYLTDGYGRFPESLPLPTLWVISPGGAQHIPLGEVTRLV
ncbi:hypothetical protein KKB55_15110 [Myxococcota bacterium]|nr:hypothetical protein [Myxococcota bacterium]